jgi:hypothetical protein
LTKTPPGNGRRFLCAASCSDGRSVGCEGIAYKQAKILLSSIAGCTRFGAFAPENGGFDVKTGHFCGPACGKRGTLSHLCKELVYFQRLGPRVLG